jgi:hypothetical protein
VHIEGRIGYTPAVTTAQEPNPYGYAGEGTVPDPRLDELEDTAENITMPEDLTDGTGDADDER